ncbi:MAG: hypothetical protein FIA97_17720, partial [Methylococcaceae bacterium]|nr:hypothetical protein [Methylococcaceae bacterium]
TIGGNGETTFGGDGRSALSAMIGFTTGLALDPVNGDVYLADSGNGRVRKLDSAGVITTVAGTGVSAYNSDGGLATLSALASPQGLAFDSVGNLFIADTYNQRIRRVDKASGNISTVAGDGVQCQSPQSPPCGDGIAATSASLNYPQAVALDSAGNLYIADGSNHVVRRVDTGGTITTVAGGGVPPVGIGDGGAAIAATLSSPNGVALDGNGNLFILDAGNSRIRRVDRASQIISTVAGGGSASPGDGGQATDAVLDQPTDITIDANGNLYIAEGYSEGGGNRVRKVDAAGIISTIAGNGGSPAFGGDGGPAIEASLHAVEAVAVDATGTVYIADSGNGRVRRVGDSKVALADTFTLDSSARLAGNDLSGLAVETSSVGYAAWTSVPATIDLLAGNATNGYVSTKTGASQPDCLGTLPLALANATATYSVSAKVFPEVIVGAGPTGSAGVGFFIANAETDLPLTTTVGTTALALLADGSGAWRMVTSATASTELLRGSVTSGNWSATAPPLLRLTWATARKTASASLDGVSLFENLDVSSIDSSQVKFVGFGCEGPLGAGALVDDFRVMELP